MKNELFRSAKWLFFDIGYTLVNEDDVWLNRCRMQSNMPGVRKMTAEQLLFELKKATADYRPNYRELMSSLGYTEFAPYLGRYEKLYPEAPGLIETLGEKYRLGIIANQAEGLISRLEAYGLSQSFEVVASSAEVGFSKPDERLFVYALEQAGCNPEEAVMIGDRLDNDIYPAKKLGMKTVRIVCGTASGQKPINKDYIPDVQVNSLGELS